MTERDQGDEKGTARWLESGKKMVAGKVREEETQEGKGEGKEAICE